MFDQRGTIHRLVWIMSLGFFGAVGYFIAGVGNPKLFYVFASPEDVATFLGVIRSPELFQIAGAILILIVFLVGLFGSLVVTFSKVYIQPKEIASLHDQGMVVFLIDKSIFWKTDATFYNLDDLRRIRVVNHLNFFYWKVDEEIEIIDPEDVVDTIHNRPEIKVNQLLEDDGFKNPKK